MFCTRQLLSNIVLTSPYIPFHLYPKDHITMAPVLYNKLSKIVWLTVQAKGKNQ